MEKFLCFLLLFSCCAGPLQGAGEEGGHAGTSTSTSSSSEEKSSSEEPPCSLSLDKLNVVFRELIGEGLEVYVNCLSFNYKGSLKSGVVSGVNESTNPSSPGVRLELSCVEGVISAKTSSKSPLNESMTTPCVDCDLQQQVNICTIGKTCVA